MTTPKHSTLSPSAAYRWMRCPGSVPLSADLPEEEAPAAEEGSIAHEAAASLLGGYNAGAEKMFAHAAAQGFDADEMRKAVGFYVDYVQGFGLHALCVEARMPLFRVLGCDAWGYADALIYNSFNELHIFDLKYGRGEKVRAVENPQLALYAAAALEEYYPNCHKICLHIVQPRLDSVEVWEPSRAEFDAFMAKVMGAAKIASAMAKLPSEFWLFRPSVEACRFCKARGICRALAEKAPPPDASEPPALSPSELSESFGRLKMLRLWADAVEKETFSRLTNGQDVPGLKLVEGRKGPRKWGDEKAAEALLRGSGLDFEAIFEQKLISPPKAEKLVKAKTLTEKQWAELSSLIVQDRTKPAVVPASDPRPTFHKLTASDFPNEELKNG